MNYVILFDLDGVIADWSHRLPYIQLNKLDADTPIDLSPANDPKPYADWDAFYAAMPDDPIIEAGATLYNLLATQCLVLGHAIREKQIEADTPFIDLISCRPEKMRQVTLDWLNKNELIMPRNLHLRADNDDRPHWRIKLDMYEQFYEGRETVLVVFEDNAETIAAFRGMGITCYQVCDGIEPSRIITRH